MPSRWDDSLLQVKPSMTSASVQVRDMSLRSLSMVLGGITLGTGIGVSMGDVRIDGMYPSLSDWL